MKRVLVSLIIGLTCFIIAYLFRTILDPGPGDFLQAIRPARDLIAGRPPLSWPTSEGYVPSPLTIIVLGLPFAGLEDRFAGALFFGLSCAWLAWLITRENHWRLLIFLSYPFFFNAMWSQFTPFVLALAFSGLAPLAMIVKPHITFPVLLTQPTRRWCWALAFIIAGASLLVYPLWPLKYLEQIRPYSGMPPILMPLGFTILLALIYWSDRSARLLLFMAFVPQRYGYDQLALFFVPKTKTGMLIMLIASWGMIVFRDRYFADGYPSFSDWIHIILCMYLPALIVLFVEHRSTLHVSPSQKYDRPQQPG